MNHRTRLSMIKGVDIDAGLLGALAEQIPEAGGRLLGQAVRRAQLLRLALRGVDAKRAAQVVGCSHATARAVYADPDFRRAAMGRLDSAFADVDQAFGQQKRSLVERMGEAAETSFTLLCELLENPNAAIGLRAKVAMDFLDRNPETQAGHVVRTGPLGDPDKLAQAARVAREMDNVLIMEKRA